MPKIRPRIQYQNIVCLIDDDDNDDDRERKKKNFFIFPFRNLKYFTFTFKFNFILFFIFLSFHTQFFCSSIFSCNYFINAFLITRKSRGLSAWGGVVVII